MLTAGTALQRCTTPSRLRRVCRSASQLRPRHHYYSSPPLLGASNDEVQVKVKLGLDRHVNLAIRQPPRPDEDAPIVVHLHHGLPDTPSAVPSTNELSIGANAIVVRLDFQISKEAPYPFPIHSVLAGYDWIRNHLLREKLRNGQHISDRVSPRIGVCGELVGGSLATMLALTECHGEERGAIRAAAVGNPIVDWTALVQPKEKQLRETTIGPSLKPSGTKVKTGSLPKGEPSLDSLLRLRAQYFAKPEKYFDAFASPLLFFRTPRYDVPGGPLASSSGSDPNDYIWLDEEPEPELVKKRLSHRNYPPLGSDLVLSKMRVELGEDNVLKDQGMEMVDLWRRSQNKRKETRFHGLDNEIETVVREGSGLWGEKEMLEIGRWLGEALREQ